MSGELSVREPSSAGDAAASQRQQFADYLAEQPASTRSAHRWLTRLEAAGFGVVAATLVGAILVSINQAGMPGSAIMAAWFALPISFSLVLLFIGLHSAVVGFFPATSILTVSGKPETGRDAVVAGAGMMVLSVLLVGYWVALGYAIMSFKVELATALLGVPIFVGIMAGLLSEIRRRF